MRTFLIMNGKTESTKYLKPEDFDNTQYEGKKLYCDRNGQLVLLMCSKSSNPSRWLVQTGISSSFYSNYQSAVKACEQMGCTPMISEKAVPISSLRPLPDLD